MNHDLENWGSMHLCIIPSRSLHNYLFPEQQILDSSKLKEFPEEISNLMKKAEKFSKWVENTVGKGEIACYEQFLLFPQCFQRTCTENT